MNKLNLFFKCGAIGWCLECFWTGINSINDKNSNKLICHTSLWMFFIYGMASFIKPFYILIRKLPIFFRGFLYTIAFFFTEFLTGNLLKKHDACPWDYSDCDLNYKGLIRLDYAPLWFIASLFYERLLRSDKQ